MTADEAARYLGLPSRKALYQAVRRGQVPATRFGRRLRFRSDDIDRAIRRTQELAA
jgi:excisionase family DNA binding protein